MISRILHIKYLIVSKASLETRLLIQEHIILLKLVFSIKAINTRQFRSNDWLYTDQMLNYNKRSKQHNLMNKSPSQTKNLVILYQKLFNMALKKCKKINKNKNDVIYQIRIRKCLSIHSFQKILLSTPSLKETMEEMFESGILLNRLIKWRGQHSNMAISLKYLNRLFNLIKHPQVKTISWGQPSQNSGQFNFKKNIVQNLVLQQPSTLNSFLESPIILDSNCETKGFFQNIKDWTDQNNENHCRLIQLNEQIKYTFEEHKSERNQWALLDEQSKSVRNFRTFQLEDYLF